MNPNIRFALATLALFIGASFLVVTFVSALDSTVPAPSRTPALRTLPACAAIEVVQGGDSIVYEVRRARGERCRVTLPEGARHVRATP